jgi:hypothetical protein
MAFPKATTYHIKFTCYNPSYTVENAVETAERVDFMARHHTEGTLLRTYKKAANDTSRDSFYHWWNETPRRADLGSDNTLL